MSDKYWTTSVKRRALLPQLMAYHLSLITLFFFSCQSDSYQINGFAQQLQEGDTVWLAYETQPAQPIQSALVHNGKFQMTGQTSLTIPCRVCVNQEPAASSTFFFLEPGNITIELNRPAELSRVSGTRLNNTWQQLNDSVQAYSLQITRLAQTLDKTADKADYQQLVTALDSLHRCMNACILHTAQRNKGNPLGQFILENYKAPEFNP